MGWEGLGDVDQVAPLEGGDAAVIADVREVLKRHGALDRFGLTLLHSHFELLPGEVLVEVVDADLRVLTTRPMVPEVADGSLVATSFRLSESGVSPMTVSYCYRSANGDFHAR